MCIIVDNNVVHAVVMGDGVKEDLALLASDFKASSGKARLVYGGYLAVEYAQSRSLLRKLISLEREGRARQVPLGLYNREKELVERKGECTSNDAHVIAVARAGNVRLLCTDDALLKQDFKNSNLIAGGKVYSSSNNHNLIAQCCKSIGQPKKKQGKKRR